MGAQEAARKKNQVNDGREEAKGTMYATEQTVQGFRSTVWSSVIVGFIFKSAIKKPVR
jgi:hypothetical protein